MTWFRYHWEVLCVVWEECGSVLSVVWVGDIAYGVWWCYISMFSISTGMVLVIIL